MQNIGRFLNCTMYKAVRLQRASFQASPAIFGSYTIANIEVYIDGAEQGIQRNGGSGFTITSFLPQKERYKANSELTVQTSSTLT